MFLADMHLAKEILGDGYTISIFKEENKGGYIIDLKTKKGEDNTIQDQYTLNGNETEEQIAKLNNHLQSRFKNTIGQLSLPENSTLIETFLKQLPLI